MSGISNMPLLVIFIGSIGVGKSYFARQLAPKINATRLNADAARLAFYGSRDVMPTHNNTEGEANNRKMFGVLDYTIREILQSGRSVVYDTARFNGLKNREMISTMAKETGARLVIVRIDTPREVAHVRVTTREETDDQTHITHERAQEIFAFHDANLNEPANDEKVITISGQIPFEEQLAQFEQQLED